MKIIKTHIPGLIIIEPDIFVDERGYFFESFHKEKYKEAGIDIDFVQDNESKSVKGVVRGLHYQLEPYAQGKLVRVIQGRVFDVAVDLRKGSPTYGAWFGAELDDVSKKQMFVPRGFAHGFSVLSETAIFSYKCDNVYSRETERGINLADPVLGIDWKLNPEEQIISEKDRLTPNFAEAEMNFKFKEI
jgi:dTDP-4-dehydrorhamnose 3,5-epimerase